MEVAETESPKSLREMAKKYYDIAIQRSYAASIDGFGGMIATIGLVDSITHNNTPWIIANGTLLTYEIAQGIKSIVAHSVMSRQSEEYHSKANKLESNAQTNQ